MSSCLTLLCAVHHIGGAFDSQLTHGCSSKPCVGSITLNEVKSEILVVIRLWY